ncbi:MAG: hypothetical protein LBH82_07020, partial [Bacteroidales bacterium]|nr:hypothetical protein [Bacteroidales bacterium]
MEQHRNIQPKQPRQAIRQLLKILLIVVLSALFASFSVQFVPTVIIGKFQVDYFILTILYIVLLFFLYKKSKKWFAIVSGGLVAVMFVLSLLGVG